MFLSFIFQIVLKLINCQVHIYFFIFVKEFSALQIHRVQMQEHPAEFGHKPNSMQNEINFSFLEEEA